MGLLYDYQRSFTQPCTEYSIFEFVVVMNDWDALGLNYLV